MPDREATIKDIPVRVRPGPSFRFVRGRGAAAFESGLVIYLLDLATGTTQVAPGFADFVPSPDGRFFVTPAADRGGIEFYSANEVFEEGAKGAGASVPPFYIDPEMRDQSASLASRASSRARLHRPGLGDFRKEHYAPADLHCIGACPTLRPCNR